MISPNIGGTALPICKFLLVLLPKKIKSSFEFLLNLTIKVMNSDEQFQGMTDKSTIIKLYKM